MIDTANESCTLAVMEIERFAIHDGPGIRTVVFLQGCPLRCGWCSNPESQQIRTQLMHINSRCTGCGTCANNCPHANIRMENGRPVFDRDKCITCKSCAEACLQNAIRFAGEALSVQDIMQVVLRDKAYYEQSGGGITVSGGEPFVQFSGLMRLLESCKKEGLHTAIETTGQVNPEKIKKAAPLTDLFLYDIKHTDKALLKKETQADLQTILSNLSYLSGYPEKVVIRIPVIPGFNFNPKDIQSIFNLAKEKGLTTIHLLPYHTLGKDKYEQLGLKYTYPHEQMLTKEQLSPFKKMGEAMGLNIQT